MIYEIQELSYIQKRDKGYKKIDITIKLHSEVNKNTINTHKMISAPYN